MTDDAASDRLFTLEEFQSTIAASLTVPNEKGFVVRGQAAPVRIAYKKPSTTQLAEIAQKQAETISGKAPQDVLRGYIRAREKDVQRNLNEIRKCIRRIESALICIENAEQAQAELTDPKRVD